jgi:hypothetical protein
MSGKCQHSIAPKQKSEAAQISAGLNASSGSMSTEQPLPMLLQQALGNQGVLGRISNGIAISHPDDVTERQADRVAEAVTSSSSTLRPRISTGSGAAKKIISRKCSTCDERDEEPQINRKAESSAIPARAPNVMSVLSSPGHPLDSRTREFMESRFGFDFGRVRIHTDARAAESARALNAQAYTTGSDIVFASSRYQPSTTSGRFLLAHELTHVVQDSGNGSARMIRRTPEDVPELDRQYAEAVKQQDWAKAAEVLNKFNREDINQRLAKLDRLQFFSIHRGAVANARVGKDAQVAQLSAHRFIQEPSKKPSTRVDAAIELTRRALVYATSNPPENDRALKILAQVETFLRGLTTDENIAKYYQDGMERTQVRLITSDAVAAVKTAQGQIRSGLGREGGLWDYYFDRVSAARTFLLVLTGEAQAKHFSLPSYGDVKESVYQALINGLKEQRNNAVNRLRAAAQKLPPNWQSPANTMIDIVAFIADMFVALILAIVGLIVGFVEGIVGMVTGIVKLVVSILTLLGDAILGIFGNAEAFHEDIDAIITGFKNLKPGLKAIVGDWWTRYKAASPERQVLMGAELVGQVEAFLVSFAFVGSKAGQVPKLTIPTQLEIRTVVKASATTGLPETQQVVVVTATKTIPGHVVAAPAGAGALTAPALMSVAAGGPGGGPSGGSGGGGRTSGRGGPEVKTVGSDLPGGRVPATDPDPALNGYRHLVDQSGRPMMAEGPVRKLPGVRGPAQGAVSGPYNVQEARMINAGHLIAREFGGSTEAFNLVPVPENINLSAMRAVERDVGMMVDMDQEIYLQVYPRYEGASRIPADVTYRIFRKHGTWKLLKETTVAVQEKPMVIPSTRVLH